MTKPTNLRVEQEPYPHLRDDAGCVLARDYQDADKLAFIVRAVNAHDEMVAALQSVLSGRCIGTAGSAQQFFRDNDDSRAAIEQARAALTRAGQ